VTRAERERVVEVVEVEVGREEEERGARGGKRRSRGEAAEPNERRGLNGALVDWRCGR
jgi:hypothetical protein